MTPPQTRGRKQQQQRQSQQGSRKEEEEDAGGGRAAPENDKEDAAAAATPTTPSTARGGRSSSRNNRSRTRSASTGSLAGSNKSKPKPTVGDEPPASAAATNNSETHEKQPRDRSSSRDETTTATTRKSPRRGNSSSNKTTTGGASSSSSASSSHPKTGSKESATSAGPEPERVVAAGGGDAVDTGTVLATGASPPPTATETTTAKSKSSSKAKKAKKQQPQQQQSNEKKEGAGPDGDNNGDKEEAPAAASEDDAKSSKASRSSSRGKKQKQQQQTTTPQTPPPAPPISKPAPTVDVTVHRMRHCDYHPKPILCLASSCAADNNNDNESSNSNSFLAVSRASGSVVLQAVAPKLRTVARVAGRANRPLTSLCWLPAAASAAHRNHPILVGAARRELCVVDFWHRCRCAAWTASGGGGVGALERVAPAAVAAACQDGSVRLFRVAVAVVDDNDNDNCTYQLLPVCVLPSAGAPVLSLACFPVEVDDGDGDDGDGGDDDLTGTVLFAGVADGTIRRYDCTSGGGGPSAATQWKPTLRMTVEFHGRGTMTRVWALKASRDGTLASGDSLGHVQFWDGNAGTLAASFDQNDHGADVLVLEMTRDGTKVFASGVDSRVVCIERQPLQSNNSNNNNTTPPLSPWVLTHAQRPHTHDVKAAAIVQKVRADGRRGAEILCTGGVDTKLCTYAVGDFGTRRPRALYPWPSLAAGPVAVAPQARLLTVRREDRIDLYEVAAAPAGAPQQMAAPVLVPEDNTDTLGTVQVKGMSNLSSSAISGDGQFLALTDSYALLLFHLNNTSGGDSGQRTLVPSKISVQLPNKMGSIGALHFVTNNLLLLASTDGRVRVISISPLDFDDDDGADAEMKDAPAQSAFHAAVVQTLHPPAKTQTSKDETGGSNNQSCLLPVHSVVASDNGNWFLTQRNSSSRNDGSIDVYRKVDDDSYQFWWALPSLGSSPVTAAAFLPTTAEAAPKLAVACIDYAMYTFDVENRCLSEWSEKAGFPVSRKVPFELASRNDFPVRIGVNPGSPSVALMGSFGAIVSMNTELNFPQQCRIFPETHVRSGKKRKRSTSVSQKAKGDDDGDDDDDDKEEDATPTTCTMCLRYNSMLYMDFIAEHEMVVVEQPWLNVVATFPDALQRKVYGT